MLSHIVQHAFQSGDQKYLVGWYGGGVGSGVLGINRWEQAAAVAAAAAVADDSGAGAGAAEAYIHMFLCEHERKDTRAREYLCIMV